MTEWRPEKIKEGNKGASYLQQEDIESCGEP